MLPGRECYCRSVSGREYGCELGEKASLRENGILSTPTGGGSLGCWRCGQKGGSC